MLTCKCVFVLIVVCCKSYLLFFGVNNEAIARNKNTLYGDNDILMRCEISVSLSLGHNNAVNHCPAVGHCTVMVTVMSSAVVSAQLPLNSLTPTT